MQDLYPVQKHKYNSSGISIAKTDSHEVKLTEPQMHSSVRLMLMFQKELRELARMLSYSYLTLRPIETGFYEKPGLMNCGRAVDTWLDVILGSCSVQTCEVPVPIDTRS